LTQLAIRFRFASMSDVSAVSQRKLLPPLLLTALLPLSFRSSTGGVEFIFLNDRLWMIAAMLWALSGTLATFAIVRWRRQAAGSQG
jgi:hypothetical protein